MSDPNNPRAFPSNAIDDRFGGMRLWDWYAAHVLAGMWANATTFGGAEELASGASAMTDCMLAERAKRFPAEDAS